MIDPETALYSLEVGQGSATVIIEPHPAEPRRSQATVIDVGESGTKLGQWLKDDVGVARINSVVLTHNDSDHIGSLAQLVQVYKRKIDKLFFVVDAKKAPRFWIPAEQWVTDGWINEISILDAPLCSRNTPGRLVLGPDDVSTFRLYCSYPPGAFSLTRLGWLVSMIRHFFTGKRNYLSAVLRVTPAEAPMPTHALVGGDLDYEGWKYLVNIGRDLRCDAFLVPHHGGPQRGSAKFGAPQLAAQVRPKFAIVPVGSSNTYKLPHEDLIRELRGTGAVVLCSQITQPCLNTPLKPGTFTNDEVLPRLPNMPRLCASGTACAGTVIVTFPPTGPEVHQGEAHQQAVDNLLPLGHKPYCRR